METEAQVQLQLFKNSEDAFERRGFANAVTMIRDIIKTLYDERSDLVETTQAIEIADQPNRGALTEDATGHESAGFSY